MTKPKIFVYDNGGKTFDRYTVIIDWDVFTMSTNATSPQGVNQYLGSGIKTVENLNLINRDLPIDYKNLPKEVKKAIQQRINL